MKKAVDISKEINEMRKAPANKKCFECGETGTTYIVQEFGVFVCSICAGIHREFSHRVKGLSMCNFTLQELETLKRQGNETCVRTWLARYNPRDFPQPSPKETQRIKDFIRLKYKERRWYQDLPPGESVPQEVAPTVTAAAKVAAEPAQFSLQKPQPQQQVSDLLSLGGPTEPSESWGEFSSPASTDINIQSTFPKAEDRKQEASTVQVQSISAPATEKQSILYSATTNGSQQKVEIPQASPPPPKQAQLPSTLFQPTPYKPQETDPFSGLDNHAGAKPAPFDPRILQQHFLALGQIYTQMYGVPYPYSFQAWLQVVFPKPASTPLPTAVPSVPQTSTEKPRKSNNPFDVFG